jgi:SAM-dependent methyltransferase
MSKKHPWYKTWFNRQDYLDLYKHRDNRDAKKILKLLFNHISLPKNSKILDVACGNGRHSLLFAMKGYSVTGIDLSPYLIRIAKSYVTGDIKHKLRFEVKDMRRINHRNEFTLAVNIFTSFGYFDNDKDNFKVIYSIADSLKRNGYFLFDFINKHYIAKNIIPYDINKTNRKVVIQLRNLTHNTLTKEIFIVKVPSGKLNQVTEHFTEKIKLYDLSTLRIIFTRAGLKIINLFGDYEGNKYKANNSPRLIILAKKV